MISSGSSSSSLSFSPESHCVVCRNRFDSGVSLKTFKCGHTFHKDCIDTLIYHCPGDTV
ncbi:RING finger domain-containing protein [Endozoicomonas elysicola]|uniref:RING finger domain-containing protein n=1 Tax=Endozoicomonas elysicola TaxID=305900 RepID=UPI0009DAA01C